jgi:hypothetical protein
MVLWETASAIEFAVICFVSLASLPSYLVMKDPMKVCPLSRGMILPVGSIPIHSITEWHSLLSSSSACHPIDWPYGSFSLAGG